MRSSISFFVMFSTSILALAAGCSTRDGGTPTPPRDSGIVLSDSGARDSGVDGGAADAGAVAMDAGPRDSGIADAGPIDANLRSCMDPVEPFPMADAPRCTAATRSRMLACAGDPVCIRTAASEDTTTPIMRGTRRIDCPFCLSAQQKYCVANHGCATQTTALECCIAASCPDGSCVMTTCSTPYSVYSRCATTTAATCLADPVRGDFAVCFPPE